LRAADPIRSRRRLLAAVLIACAVPVGARAQTKGRVWRLAIFQPGTPESNPERTHAFLAALEKLGYVTRRNLVVEEHYGSGKPETYPAIAKEIVARSPDCIFAAGIDTALALRQATATIPIVLGTIDTDPAKEGLVASLARPGGNVTGLSGIAWQLVGKRLEILKEIAPQAVRIGVLTDTRSPAAAAHLSELDVVAPAMKLQFQVYPIADAASVDEAFRKMRQARVDALFVINVGAVNSHRRQIVGLVNAARWPAIYSLAEAVADGGLVAYTPNLKDQYQRAAVYVDRIFRGAKPGELPMEQSRYFELVINVQAAKAIGLTLPQSLLNRAERVIQ
jgi:putative ABC transport system substrate-binding protein